MSKLEQVKQRLEDIEVVRIARKRELKLLKVDLAEERLKFKPSKVRLAEFESSISKLKTQIEVELPGLKKQIMAEVQKEAEAEREKPQLLEQQQEIIKELKKDSAALLELLEKSLEINTRIIDLNSKFRLLEEKTKSEIDRSNVSSGFATLKIVRNVLRDEIDIGTRTVVFWPPQQRRFRL